MNSSMLAGERRRASSRRGGMTILGKVAVPKPINLPSQKLENHGQDANVEIVPKGTLNWGSRSSSSVSSSWGSSLVSPNTDGGTSSTSYLGGRPSSGGSGTRRSTAGSDRTQEPIDSAWCSNSRPSSVSGVSSSNQTSLTSLRTESAETRPNSSHVSRFVEPVSGSLVTWDPNSTTEGTGVACFKEDGFSSSSGDFPRLGSDRDNGKNSESQDNDHGCARSASGRIPQINEKSTSQADDASVSLDVTGGSGRKMPQQHFNADVTFQHFDAWGAPPVNAPASVWYSGPPGGPPLEATSLEVDFLWNHSLTIAPKWHLRL